MDLGEGDGHQLEVRGAVALFEALKVVPHASFQGAGAFGFLRRRAASGSGLQGPGCRR